MQEMRLFNNISDKYNMSVEGNIFYAKRCVVDSIWKSANLEGIAVTYPQTYQLYNNATVANLTIKDTVTINNLKHAWMFILDLCKENVEIDIQFIKQLNHEVGSYIVNNAGAFRTGNVRIGGTSWTPYLPDIELVKEELNKIKSISCCTDRAFSYMLYLMRSQLFWDGNKRTAMFVCNYELIRNGKGILSIPLEYQEKFLELLIEYYENGDAYTIKKFMYDNCLDGTDI